MTPSQIISLLQEYKKPNYDRSVIRWHYINLILEEASTVELINALLKSEAAFTQYLLICMLGERADISASPVLERYAHSKNFRLRNQAQYALRTIQDYQTRQLSSASIAKWLDSPPEDWDRAEYEISVRAPIDEIIGAIAIAKTDIAIENLCHILGRKRDDRAIPTLVKYLQDSRRDIQVAAAKAITTIDPLDQSTESHLLEYENKFDSTLFVRLLRDTDEFIRGVSAWILGELQINDARAHIENSLITEETIFAKACMIKAIGQLNKDIS